MRDHNHSGLEIDLSIIIVNWNKSDLTRTCLKSIAENTSGVSYEVLVVDNGSDADEIASLRKVCTGYQARLIELKHNLFFGEANNIGAEFAHGATLLLLNNDVIVPAGYALPLLQTLRNAYCAGAVGPKFIYPDGRLQEAGAYIRPDGWSIQHGKADAPAAAISADGPHIVDYCSAACLLIGRNTFLRAGGFDPLFDPAYFEDADLMFRLRSRGLFTYLCTDVTVVHYENATSSEVWDRRRLDEVTIANHRRFMERWGGYVSKRLSTVAEMPRFEEILWTAEDEASLDLPVVRIHGPGQVRHSQEWAEIIILASKLAAEHHIEFVADEFCSRCRVLTLASRAGVKLGSFSIARASAVEMHPEDTIISFRAGIQKAIEVVSVSGPRLDQIKNALQTMGLF